MPSVANVRLALRRTPGNLLIPLPFTSNWLRSFIPEPHGIPMVKAALEFSSRTHPGHARRNRENASRIHSLSPQIGFVPALVRDPGFPW